MANYIISENNELTDKVGFGFTYSDSGVNITVTNSSGSVKYDIYAESDLYVYLNKQGDSPEYFDIIVVSDKPGKKYKVNDVIYSLNFVNNVYDNKGLYGHIFGANTNNMVIYDNGYIVNDNVGIIGNKWTYIGWLMLYSNYKTEVDDDPYNGGGSSESGGGTGNFDGTGDAIQIPSLPTLASSDTGFITLFNPTISQMRNLANYMWSGAFDLETFKKIFADPMDCILGLSIVPVSIPNTEVKEVKVGNISTGISMNVAATQFVEVDCGSLNVNEYWGSYLDYSPYTKAELYLPYIGTHQIDVDDIMNKTVHIVYHVDILSGACSAVVKCGESVLYQFIGQCSANIPITSIDWTNVINGVISIARSIGSMVATGGASAPMSIGAIASSAVNSLKPNIEKSGSVSGTGGMLSVQTPYLILTRPRQAKPKQQNKFVGYPSFITDKLSSLNGYTEVESIHLEGISATKQEVDEIEKLLMEGVIL